jgi:N-acetylmuramoyl-L-alanine amidase
MNFIPMIKTFFLCSIALLSLCSFKEGDETKTPTRKLQKTPLRTIIVDAGHGITPSGGYDGAPGTYSHEDDICLAVAKKLVAALKREMPEVKVVETRPDKYKVSLYRRADIANENKGDLFISIHVNSADGIRHKEFSGYRTETYYTGKGKKRKKKTRQVATYRYYTTPNPAKGTETYIWGAGKTGDKTQAAIDGGSGLEHEEALDSATAALNKDFDPKSPESIMLASLKVKQYFERSARLALTVEEEFKKAGRISREARQRQKGIWVLQATNMPSILVETGYISNREEEDYLNSEQGQLEIADVVVSAVKRYRYSLEHSPGSGSNTPTTTNGASK